MKRNEFPGSEELTLAAMGLNPEELIDVGIVFRVLSVHNDRPNYTIRVGRFVVVDGKRFRLEDVPSDDLAITKKAQPGIPAEDITDEETGEVFKSANSDQLPLPSYQDFLDLAIPNGVPVPTTQRELIQFQKRVAYLFIASVRPAWASGVEVDLPDE